MQRSWFRRKFPYFGITHVCWCQISRIFGWNPKMFQGHISIFLSWNPHVYWPSGHLLSYRKSPLKIKISRRYSTWIEWVILYGKLLKDPRVASFIQIDLPLYPYQYAIIFHSYPMIRSYPVIFPSLAALAVIIISREGKSPFIINHHHACYESPYKSPYKITINPMFGGQVIKHNNHHEIINPIFIMKATCAQSRKLKLHASRTFQKSGKVRSLEPHLCT